MIINFIRVLVGVIYAGIVAYAFIKSEKKDFKK
jgi:hypothetical protein